MYGKPAPKRSGNGISGFFKNQYFRSLLELSYILFLEMKKIKYESGESVKHKISYEIDGVTKTYFPDFFIPELNEYHEVKPSSLVSNKCNDAKSIGAKKENKKIVFITEKDIQRIDKSTLINLIESGDVIIDSCKQHYISKYKGK